MPSSEGALKLRQALMDLWQAPQNLLGLGVGIAKTGKLPTHSMDAEGNREFRFETEGEDPLAIGSSILAPKDIKPEHLAHERVHTEQSRRMGPLFMPARILGDQMSKLTTGDPYLDHPLEDEAYLRTAGREELLQRLNMKRPYMAKRGF